MRLTTWLILRPRFVRNGCAARSIPWKVVEDEVGEETERAIEVALDLGGVCRRNVVVSILCAFSFSASLTLPLERSSQSCILRRGAFRRRGSNLCSHHIRYQYRRRS